MTIKRLIGCASALLLLLCILCVPAMAATAPVLEVNPASPIWPEGSMAHWSCSISDGNQEFYDYRWFIVYNGVSYDTCDFDNLETMPWYQYGDPDLQFGIGAIENQYFISGIRKELNGAEIYCTAENALGTVVSARAVIRVTDATEPAPPENLDMPAYLSVEQDEELILTCKATKAPDSPGSLHHLWFSSSSGSMQDATAVNRGTESNATLKVDTSAPGVMTYYCGVYTDGGMYENNFSFTGAVTVEVLEKETVEAIEILEEPEKLLYQEGETVDLKGLRLRVTTSKGFFDLDDLSELAVGPEVLTGAGKHMVTLTYEGKSIQFEAEVENPEPEKPTIEIQPKGGDFTIGEGKPQLSVKAAVSDKGRLIYTWYSCTDGRKASLRPISYTDSETLILPQTEGTVYYSVYIWNSLNDLESEPAVSDLVPVTFTVPVGEEPEEENRQEEPAPKTEPEEFTTAGEEEKTEQKNGEEELLDHFGEQEETGKNAGRKSYAFLILIVFVILLALGGGVFLIVRLVRNDRAERYAEAETGEQRPAQPAAAASRVQPRRPDMEETLVLPPQAFDDTIAIDPDELNLTRIMKEFGNDAPNSEKKPKNGET